MSENTPSSSRPHVSAPRSRSPLKNYLLLLVVGFALILLWDVLGFFLFLMLMGAALSYLGDQLGSYCGKQRLSIFGLRPKYTANVINLLTGLVITAMTLFGAVWVSEDIRDAVFRVAELKQQAETLAAERLRLTEDISTVQEELEGLCAKYEETLASNEDLDREKRVLLQEKQDLEAVNAGLAKRFGDLDRANEQLESDLRALEVRRRELDASIRDKLVEIDRLNRALEKKETAPVVISRGQVLLDQTIAVPLQATTGALHPLLAEAAERIRTRVELLDVQVGVEGVEHLAAEGARVVAHRLREIEGFYRNRVLDGAETADEVPRECHISLVSTRNVSVGERLHRVAFEVKPNILIYPAGAEVARTVVEGTLPPEKILDQLLYFDQQVRSVLREQGVSASVLRGQRGSANPQRLLELVSIGRQVHEAGRSVVVRCLVEQGVWAFGEPTLVFDAILPRLREEPRTGGPSAASGQGLTTGSATREERSGGEELEAPGTGPFALSPGPPGDLESLSESLAQGFSVVPPSLPPDEVVPRLPEPDDGSDLVLDLPEPSFSPERLLEGPPLVVGGGSVATPAPTPVGSVAGEPRPDAGPGS